VDPVKDILTLAVTTLDDLYGLKVEPQSLVISPTRPEYEGQYTLVTFPLAKQLKKSPEEVGAAIGEALVNMRTLISGFQAVKGFLNLSLSDTYWMSVVEYLEGNAESWKSPAKDERVLVEFSSPNTNKPLHLGHIRNILLGWSTSKILEAAGYSVVRVQIVNDRGIAICKSMLAWQRFCAGDTPESTGVKPDHFVGQWYVRFEEEFRKEYSAWQSSADGMSKLNELGEGKDAQTFFAGYKNTYFNEISALGLQAREMLKQWEAGDPETIALWKRMNSWVYAGFDETYARLGVEFDKLYYESDTWELGKEMVMQGLAKGAFYRKDDGSIWVDLEDLGLDKKILLRSDGTSVYITQDLGTAHLRYQDFKAQRMVYVVADEQDYHFQALFGTLKKLNEPYADGLYHLNYGMVDLPSGKMKSREGTVVDADDLMDTVFEEARKAAADRGEIDGMEDAERQDILRKISLAALKYFILRVDPRKRMLFDPAESVDLQGQTGPYIQNAYVRIRSILARTTQMSESDDGYTMNQDEKRLLSEVLALPETIRQAANQYSPALLAQYCYNLAKAFHRYYHDYRVLNAETEQARTFRIRLVTQVADVLRNAMELLGIEMPEKM